MIILIIKISKIEFYVLDSVLKYENHRANYIEY